MCDGELIQNFGDYKISEEYGNLIGVRNETDKIYFDFCVDVDSDNIRSIFILCNTERTIKKCCPAGTIMHRSGNIFDCKQSSDPVILEDIIQEIEEKPNIKILYSEHQIFFRRNGNFSSFDQSINFDCVDKISDSWVLFSRIQRPLSPWLEIVSIFFVILFILHLRTRYFDPHLLIYFNKFKKKEIIEDEAATSLNPSSSQKSQSQPQNKSFSKRSLKKIIPIKLLLFYATLILVKLILSISFEIFQKPQLLFCRNIILVSSSCVLMSVWFEIVFRKRINKKSNTYYFLSVILISLAMASIFSHLAHEFNEIGEFDQVTFGPTVTGFSFN
jgi:hypothetical protein